MPWLFWGLRTHAVWVDMSAACNNACPCRHLRAEEVGVGCSCPAVPPLLPCQLVGSPGAGRGGGRGLQDDAPGCLCRAPHCSAMSERQAMRGGHVPLTCVPVVYCTRLMPTLPPCGGGFIGQAHIANGAAAGGARGAHGQLPHHHALRVRHTIWLAGHKQLKARTQRDGLQAPMRAGAHQVLGRPCTPDGAQPCCTTPGVSGAQSSKTSRLMQAALPVTSCTMHAFRIASSQAPKECNAGGTEELQATPSLGTSHYTASDCLRMLLLAGWLLPRPPAPSCHTSLEVTPSTQLLL